MVFWVECKKETITSNSSKWLWLLLLQIPIWKISYTNPSYCTIKCWFAMVCQWQQYFTNLAYLWRLRTKQKKRFCRNSMWKERICKMHGLVVYTYFYPNVGTKFPQQKKQRQCRQENRTVELLKKVCPKNMSYFHHHPPTRIRVNVGQKK